MSAEYLHLQAENLGSYIKVRAMFLSVTVNLGVLNAKEANDLAKKFEKTAQTLRNWPEIGEKIDA